MEPAGLGDCRVSLKRPADIQKLVSLILASYEAEAARVSNPTDSAGDSESSS